MIESHTNSKVTKSQTNFKVKKSHAQPGIKILNQFEFRFLKHKHGQLTGSMLSAQCTQKKV